MFHKSVIDKGLLPERHVTAIQSICSQFLRLISFQINLSKGNSNIAWTWSLTFKAEGTWLGNYLAFQWEPYSYTLKTGMPIDDGDSILKSLRGVSLSETKLGVQMNCNGIYFSTQEEIAFFSTDKWIKTHDTGLIGGANNFCLQKSRMPTGRIGILNYFINGHSCNTHDSAFKTRKGQKSTGADTISMSFPLHMLTDLITVPSIIFDTHVRCWCPDIIHSITLHHNLMVILYQNNAGGQTMQGVETLICNLLILQYHLQRGRPGEFSDNTLSENSDDTTRLASGN